MAVLLTSAAGSHGRKRPSLLLTLAIATAAAAKANRPHFDMQVDTAGSAPLLPREPHATAGSASDTVAQHPAGLEHGVLRDAMPHGNADKGPRTRVRAAAALQELERVESGETHMEAKHDFTHRSSRGGRNNKDKQRVSPILLESVREKLQAIHDSETRSANNNEESITVLDNQNKGGVIDPQSPQLEENTKTKTTVVVVEKKGPTEAEIEQRWAVWGTRYMLEEAAYAVDTVPAWLQGIMFVINMMIGSAVIYFLHTTKYHAVHGCATAFCFFCCWPCGILSLCFPVDEATPDKPRLPDPQRRESRRESEGQRQEEEIGSSILNNNNEEPRTSVSNYDNVQEPRTSIASGMPEVQAAAVPTSEASGMPEVSAAATPTPEAESNELRSTVNVSLT